MLYALLRMTGAAYTGAIWHRNRAMQKLQGKTRSGLLLILDAFALTVALGASYHALKAGLHTIQTYTAEEIQTYILGLYLSFLVTYFTMRASDELFSNTWQKEAQRILRLYGLFALVFALFLFLIKSPMVDSRYLFVITMCLGASLTFLLRMLYKRMRLKAYSEEKTATLIGIVTTRERAEMIIRDVKKDWTRKIVAVYLFEEAPITSEERILDVPVRRIESDLTGCVRHDALDELLFHVPYETLMRMSNDIEEIKSMGAVVHLYVPLAETYAGAERTVDMIGDCPVVSIAAKSLDPGLLFIKRVFDVLMSGIGLIIAAPVMLLVALPLLLESKGPLFFSQTRVGLNGRTFRIYKLRSINALVGGLERTVGKVAAKEDRHGVEHDGGDDLVHLPAHLEHAGQQRVQPACRERRQQRQHDHQPRGRALHLRADDSRRHSA